jgi:hypothetical protein
VFGLSKPKLRISPDEKRFIDDSFRRLAALLGAHRLLKATVVLPTDEHFPDPYDRSDTYLRQMFSRVAARMEVDPAGIDLTLFASAYDLSRELVPFFSGKDSGAAGLYHHAPEDRPHIEINAEELKNPMSLVAVLAHEIGHIILLRPGLVDRDEPDMEPLNDLLMVFLGFGIFTANSAFRFQQHNDYMSQGWSTRRLGYLSEEQLGYGLARFAYERDESKPSWAKFLTANVASSFKRSASWLADNQKPRLLT